MAIPKSGEAMVIDVVVLKIVTCFEEVPTETKLLVIIPWRFFRLKGNL